MLPRILTPSGVPKRTPAKVTPTVSRAARAALGPTLR
jgi:hypothetical protein